jgi:hypothetical protein
LGFKISGLAYLRELRFVDYSNNKKLRICD